MLLRNMTEFWRWRNFWANRHVLLRGLKKLSKNNSNLNVAFKRTLIFRYCSYFLGNFKRLNGFRFDGRFRSGLFYPPVAYAFIISAFIDDSDDDVSGNYGGGGGNFGRKNDEMFYAARTNDADNIYKMIKSGASADQRHTLGWTPLHLAAFHGCSDSVTALLEGGANIDATDEFSTVAEVSKAKKLHVMDVLWTRQEEFSARLRASSNYRGTTPLHYAVLGDQVGVVQILINKGADPTLENEAGHLAIDYSRDPQTKKLLEEYSKKYADDKKKRELEERLKYPLEQRLKEQIIGQEAAINTVAATIRRKQNGWLDDEHPLVFLFLGSSGIGKTELAKQVAKYLHKDVKKGFIRIDMSEYQQKHEVAKFIGSPPGYVGYDDGGQLTKKLKECSNAVVLFDEIEKAHPDVLTIMLQLFDEGRLTDGHGNTIECKDAIFIMTSNLAADEIAAYGVKLREEAAKQEKEKLDTSTEIKETITVSKNFKEKIVRPILKRHFKRDEFLGRITEMVYFLPFSRTELMSLVAKELEFWRKRALDKHRVEISWDRHVLNVLADGYNVHYGARSIKHEVERRVVNKLAAAYEKQLVKEGSLVRIYTNLTDNSPESSRENAIIEFEIIDKGSGGGGPNIDDISITDRLKKLIRV